MKKEMLILVIVLYTILVSFAIVSANDIEQNVTVEVIPNETSEILINEFVTDPQTDWNNSSGLGSTDEWIELFNNEPTTVNLSGWNLSLIDATEELEILDIIMPPKSYYVLLNPDGQQSNDGQIVLHDRWGRLIDSVTYGDFDDGNEADNAPDGNANDEFDECLARFPNAKDTGVDADDFVKTKCTFGAQNNFLLIPITITNNPADPLCALPTTNVTLSAHINGSIQTVIVSYTINNTTTNVTLPGSTEDTYTFTVPASELVGASDLEWQFIVLDIANTTNLGPLEILHINSETILTTNPDTPDGLGGWFISEPTFTLTNPDALPNQTFYEWDSIGAINYTGPFGLENIPNAPPIESAGILNLKWNSELACGTEPRQIRVFKVDLTDPIIKNLEPENNSVLFTDFRPTIEALLDERFQSNSGINESTVVMTLDGSVVPITISQVTGLKSKVMHFPQSDLTLGIHTVTLSVSDNAGRASQTQWQFEIAPLADFTMQIHEPTAGIFTERRIPFNISLSREAEEIEFINHADRNPRFRRLCRDCVNYGFDSQRLRTLKEGENNITIRALDPFNGHIQDSVFLTIDSRVPRITRTEPSRGFASGFFDIQFTELNPTELILHYGNNSETKNKTVDIAQDCTADEDDYECSTFIDLQEFNEQEISYFVTLKDIAGNFEESREREIKVDISAPIINSLTFEIDGRRALLNLNITEPFFDEVVYIDNEASNPREKRICSRLNDLEICEKSESFRDGEHNLTIIARDEAGNEANASVMFSTDSRSPRIRRTEPRSGFTNGSFTVEFREQNPNELFLNYKNETESRFQKVNLTACEQDEDEFFCPVFVDLSEFESQEIEYWFNLTDKIGNTDESRERDLIVDTLPPSLNLFNFTQDEERIEFIINITEENFDEINYIDNESSNPRERRLCSRLDDFEICERSLRFRSGQHSLDIFAIDEAGNQLTVIENLDFQVI